MHTRNLLKSIFEQNKTTARKYEKLLNMANSNVSVSLNQEGQIEIKDNIRSITKMQFMMYGNNSSDFSQNGIERAPALTFNANNALVIDKPYINFFKQLDGMIEAVRKGIYRPDALGNNYNADLRNILPSLKSFKDFPLHSG